jgi:Ca-activated chloride channel family protein
MSPRVLGRRLAALALLLGVAAGGALLLTGCTTSVPTAPVPGKTAVEQPAPAGSLELVVAYGSEKEAWLTEVTNAFNQGRHAAAGGKPVFVRLRPMGSGESIDEVLSGRLHAHLVSPASAAFIELGNADSRAHTGKDLVGRTRNLVLSPVVIAMWKPMAEALGWGRKPVGWSDILALARDPKGWASHDHPEWGTFKFGHTHPDYSNSGLIALFAEVYAATGKVNGLTPQAVNDPAVGRYLGDIEKAVVHYGSSTGFFGNKMFANGPQYLSAAVLYENMVIESYAAQPPPALPVVAVYPREGTFWSDHPIGIVERDWVTPEHRAAAEAYINFLLDRPQQEKALAHGFRPGDVQVGLAAPIDAAHGVDPKEPQTTLEVPNAETIAAIKQLWQRHKKHSHLVLVFDTSGSMQREGRMTNARPGAVQLVSMLGDDDLVSLLPFSTSLNWADRAVPLKTGRQQITRRIEGLFPGGETALYDAIDAGYQFLQQNPAPDRISAVVVLTDGEDNRSRLSLEQLLQRVRFDAEKNPIRVFTIGYGAEARKDVLKRIADATEAKAYEGKPENIREVFKEIATFF